MTVLRLLGVRDYDQWRTQVRRLLQARISPDHLEWKDPEAEEDLWGQRGSLDGADALLARQTSSGTGFRVPAEFPQLARYVLCHRNAAKWPLLYRLLWRLSVLRERNILSKALDDDVFTSRSMAKGVRRDVHKMKAFVRFCRVTRGAGEDHYVAYHRSEHPIIGIAAAFFVRRFGVLSWTILTQFGSANWQHGELSFGPAASPDQSPSPDSLEEFWKTYYASTFNPARVNPRMMSKEMPRKYWSTLPEAEIIEQLLANAPARTEAMIARQIGGPAGGASTFVPVLPTGERGISLKVLRDAAATCRGCDLYRDATCTVFGEGRADAKLMLIGEQPGDHEDLAGRPFVGPAGQLLDRALMEAGLDRGECYVTNAVKHFKWTPSPRGKRRLHSKPSAIEVRSCKPWLEAELAAVRPRVIVTLGATAGQSLLGAGFRVQRSRGTVLRDPALASAIVPTIHPSAILRVSDAALASQQFEELVADFGVARRLLESSGQT